jgi:hypothetical protein
LARISAWAIGLDGVEQKNDNCNRTIGLRSGSNSDGAIFILTFAAIDTILRHFCEPVYHCSAANGQPLLREGKSVTSVRGGIHERGEFREQVDV